MTRFHGNVSYRSNQKDSEPAVQAPSPTAPKREQFSPHPLAAPASESLLCRFRACNPVYITVDEVYDRIVWHMIVK